MTPDVFLSSILDPSLIFLKGVTGLKSDDRARVLLLAIAGQESGWTLRRQQGGPAHGFWQFERGGGVRGVLNHPASAHHATKLCTTLSVPTDEQTVYEKLVWNDRLSTAFARLLLWTDPNALPEVGAQDEAWEYYERNWRPGRPRPESWPERYLSACQSLAAGVKG